MKNAVTQTQKYNDLKAFVMCSYADEKERNKIWEYIKNDILMDNNIKSQERRLEAYFRLVDPKGRLAHIDIVVDATDFDKRTAQMDKAFPDAIDKARPNPWLLACYGESIGTDHELNRFFYLKKE